MKKKIMYIFLAVVDPYLLGAILTKGRRDHAYNLAHAVIVERRVDEELMGGVLHWRPMGVQRGHGRPMGVQRGYEGRVVLNQLFVLQIVGQVTYALELLPHRKKSVS